MPIKIVEVQHPSQELRKSVWKNISIKTKPRQLTAIHSKDKRV